MVGAGEVFTLFFVTLGPLKILGPFAAQTRGLEASALRGIAFRVFAISLLALALGGWLGQTLAVKWNVSIPALTITAGIIFFLIALRLVLEQYQPQHEAPPAPLPEKLLTAALQVTFPTVVTPYGIAALIALLAAASNMVRHETIWAILVAVMVLNLLAMLAARAVMHGLVVLGMRVLGAVLGVLQVALAVQIILRGLHDIGVVS